MAEKFKSEVRDIRKHQRATCLPFLRIADLFNFVSSPATIFFSSIILSLMEDLYLFSMALCPGFLTILDVLSSSVVRKLKSVQVFTKKGEKLEIFRPSYQSSNSHLVKMVELVLLRSWRAK